MLALHCVDVQDTRVLASFACALERLFAQMSAEMGAGQLQCAAAAAELLDNVACDSSCAGANKIAGSVAMRENDIVQGCAEHTSVAPLQSIRSGAVWLPN